MTKSVKMPWTRFDLDNFKNFDLILQLRYFAFSIRVNGKSNKKKGVFTALADIMRPLPLSCPFPDCRP